MSIEWIKDGQKILAVIITAEYQPDKTEFITPPDYTQQIGFIVNKKGKTIVQHLHLPVERTIVGTPEVLYIKSGKVEVSLYSNEKKLVVTKMLNKGDIILLMDGGHGFKMMEDAVIMEIKQGPYVGIEDKEHFA